MNSISFFRIQSNICCLFLLLSIFLQGEEKLFCPFDDRTWKIGFETQTSDEKITELILQNEDITQWNELFTVQIFKGLAFDVSNFMKALEKISKENLSPHDTLQFKILEKDPFNIVETAFILKQNQDFLLANNEYNIGCVIKGENDLLYYLRYSSKDAELFKKNEEAWIKRFKLAYAAPVAHENQQGRWLVFTSTGVMDQTQPLLPQTEYQFIENKQVGYSLSLPKDWNIQNVDAKSSHFSVFNESLRFSNPDKRIEGQVTYIDLPEESRLKTAEIQYYDFYKKKNPYAELMNKGNIQTINGQNGNYLILVNDNKKGWVNFMCINKRVYCLEGVP